MYLPLSNFISMLLNVESLMSDSFLLWCCLCTFQLKLHSQELHRSSMLSQEFTPLDMLLLDNAIYILASAEMVEKISESYA